MNAPKKRKPRRYDLKRADEFCVCLYCGHVICVDWAELDPPLPRTKQENGVVYFRGVPCCYCLRNTNGKEMTEYRLIIFPPKEKKT